MTAIALRRSFNDLVTRYWTALSNVYNFPLVQRHIYRPAQDDTIKRLREHHARRIVDIACGTEILASRIQAEPHPAAVFGVYMSGGTPRLIATGLRRLDLRRHHVATVVSWLP